MAPLEKCPSFKPGQFLHLAIDNYDPGFHWPESRVFSVASSPTRLETIRITFSVKGKYTKRMFTEVEEGDIVWLKLPYGSFTFTKHKSLIFVAGGTGITPFLSFLEHAIDNDIDNDIRLYYGVRKPEYLIFGSLLEQCKKSLKNFSQQIFIENSLEAETNLRVHKGVLDINLIINSTKDIKEGVYFLAGPRPMIESFKKTLKSKGIEDDRIFIDSWE